MVESTFPQGDSAADANSSADVLPTRRSLRPLAHSRVVSRPQEDISTAVVNATRRERRAAGSAKRRVRSTAVLALVVPGLVATVGLPAVAAFDTADNSALSASVLQIAKTDGQQSLTVSGDVESQAPQSSGITATTLDELNAARDAEAQREADRVATERRAEIAAQQAEEAEEYGPTAITAADSSVDAAESAPAAIDGDTSYQSQLFAEALKYQGVPYVLGGATPAGFDCSGFVQYVYAKFGKSLPHSSTAQGAMGTPIPMSEAVPGDLLVAPGHIGFYAGNGQILHASQPGVPLRIGGLYQDYHAVRLPIS